MPNSLIVCIDENTKIINRDDPRYNLILTTVSEHGLDKQKVIEALAYKSVEDNERIVVKPKEDKLLIDGKEMPEALKNAYLDIKRRRKASSYLLKFWDRLQQNPNKNSINMLFTFLEHNAHPIMSDGRFIAYKAVRPDLKDHHTNTNIHRVGKVIRMKVADVNSDPTVTCAAGLHVCSWEYTKSFHPDNSVYLEVLIDPKDVVCVPNDYNGTKMRVCAYKVYRQVKEPRDLTSKTKAAKIHLYKSESSPWAKTCGAV